MSDGEQPSGSATQSEDFEKALTQQGLVKQGSATYGETIGQSITQKASDRKTAFFLSFHQLKLIR